MRRGPLAHDPALDPWRLPPSDLCWWCGAPATTQEHRIKHSTLRRIAQADSGEVELANTYKVADDFEGPLRSLKKGSQVKWRKNMCANCNNARSQPFDYAYDVMETFLIQHADELITRPRLAWADVYGEDWQPGATSLARYFGKQLGCMLAGQRLPIPEDLIAFLNGSPRCPSVTFMLYRNWRGGAAHRTFLNAGLADGITTFVGLLPSTAYQRDGALSGVDYGYHIGYVWFVVNWTAGSDRHSWWEFPEVDLPLINGGLRSRVGWRLHEFQNKILNRPDS